MIVAKAIRNNANTNTKTTMHATKYRMVNIVVSSMCL